MGWRNAWQKVKGWGSAIWNSPTAAKIVRTMTEFSYNTVGGVFGQIGVLPDTLYSWGLEPEVRKLAGHIALTTSDFALITLVSWADQYAQDQGKDYLDNNPDEALMSAHTALIFLAAVHYSAITLSHMRSLQFSLRMAVIIEECSSILNDAARQRVKSLPAAHDSPFFPKNHSDQHICDNCSVLRKTQGSMRGVVTYYAVEYAIFYLKNIPLIGPMTAYGLSIYHNGRYIVGLKVGNVLCDRHKEIYLDSYKSLALSYGVSHLLATELLSFLIASMGAPVYRTALQQLLLPFFVSIAAHMATPPALIENKTKGFDPLGAYVWLTGTLFDIFCLGAKKWLGTPRGVAFRQNLILWWRTPQKPLFDLQLLEKRVLVLWSHPVTEGIKFLGFPMLRSQKVLINDPIIQPNFDKIRAQFIEAVATIEEKNESIPSFVLNIGTQYEHPRFTVAMLLKASLGIKIAFADLLLQAFGDKNLIAYIGRLRRIAESIMTGEAPPVPVNKKALPLRVSEEEFLEKVQKPIASYEGEPIIPLPAFANEEPQEPADQKVYSFRQGGGMFAPRPKSKEAFHRQGANDSGEENQIIALPGMM